MFGNVSDRETVASYVVLARDAIVAQDLVETILEHDPGAVVHRARNFVAAAQEIEAAPRLAAVLLDIDPALLAASQLPAVIAARGGRLVVMGNAAEEAAATLAQEHPDWIVLMRPFDSETTAAVLGI